MYTHLRSLRLSRQGKLVRHPHDVLEAGGGLFVFVYVCVYINGQYIYKWSYGHNTPQKNTRTTQNKRSWVRADKQTSMAPKRTQNK